MINTIEKIRVTNEEYQKILQQEADNYWKKVFAIDKSDFGIDNVNLSKLKNAYYQEMNIKLDRYEIIPFTVNCKNEKINKLINNLCTEEEQKEGYTRYKGFTRRDYLFPLLSEGFKSINTSSSYTEHYHNTNELVTASYCEGDVYFCVYNSEEDFNKGLQSAIKFYEEN
jgi:hypothetical protein